MSPILSRSRSRSGSSRHTTREGRTRTVESQSWKQEQRQQPKLSLIIKVSMTKRRSRSPSRRSRPTSKSRRSSPHTSLGHAWTADGSSDQPASWMLSTRTKRKILAGEYVDFDTILTLYGPCLVLSSSVACTF